MKKTSRLIGVGAALLLATSLLGGCVYQPTPGYGYYAPYGPAPAAVYVGGGWGWGGGWGHGGGRWR